MAWILIEDYALWNFLPDCVYYLIPGFISIGPDQETERTDSPVRFVFAFGSKRLSRFNFERPQCLTILENNANRTRLLIEGPRHDYLAFEQKAVLLSFVLVESAHDQSLGDLLVRGEADRVVDPHFVVVLASASLRFYLSPVLINIQNAPHLVEHII